MRIGGIVAQGKDSCTLNIDNGDYYAIGYSDCYGGTGYIDFSNIIETIHSSETGKGNSLGSAKFYKVQVTNGTLDVTCRWTSAGWQDS